MLAIAAGTGHSNWNNASGSTSSWMRKVRCWRWLFGKKITFFLMAKQVEDADVVAAIAASEEARVKPYSIPSTLDLKPSTLDLRLSDFKNPQV